MSAAEMTVDSGALATTIPRRVAASTSTLSTPTPARPITFSRSARSMRSEVSFVADRMMIASYSPISLGEIAVQVDVDVEALAQELDSGVGDLLADEDRGRPFASLTRVLLEGLVVRLARPGAAFDVGAGLGQRQLDRRQGRWTMSKSDGSRCDRCARSCRAARPGRLRASRLICLRTMEKDLLAVDALGHADRGHDRRAVLVGREQLEPHRLDARAAGAAQADVAVERLLEARPRAAPLGRRELRR